MSVPRETMVLDGFPLSPIFAKRLPCSTFLLLARAMQVARLPPPPRDVARALDS